MNWRLTVISGSTSLLFCSSKLILCSDFGTHLTYSFVILWFFSQVIVLVSFILFSLNYQLFQVYDDQPLLTQKPKAAIGTKKKVANNMKNLKLSLEEVMSSLLLFLTDGKNAVSKELLKTMLLRWWLEPHLPSSFTDLMRMLPIATKNTKKKSKQSISFVCTDALLSSEITAPVTYPKHVQKQFLLTGLEKWQINKGPCITTAECILI